MKNSVWFELCWSMLILCFFEKMYCMIALTGYSVLRLTSSACFWHLLVYCFVCLSVAQSDWVAQLVRSDSAIPWTVTHQAPLSMEFSRPEYRSGLPFPSPGDLSDPEVEPTSPTLQADSLPSEPLKGCYWTMKDTGILGLQRRRIQFRARDEAWSLRAFV